MTTIVQQASGQSSVELTLANPVTAGNTLVAALAQRGGSIEWDYAGAGWTEGPDGQSTGAGGDAVVIVYKHTDGTEPQFITGAPSFTSGSLYEVAGFLDLGQHNENTGTGFTLSSGSITTAAGFIVGIGAQGVGGGYDSAAAGVHYSVGAGWTEDHDNQTVGGGHPTVVTGHRFDAGTYAFTATNELPSGDGWISQIVSFTVAPEGGGSIGGTDDGDPWIDVTDDLVSWTITRGASAEITGGAQPGNATLTVRRLERDGKYNPRNASSPLYGILRDGCRVHIAVNDDGTLGPGADTVYGLFAGRITDITQVQTALDDPTPVTELYCEDPLAWYGRTPARVADSRTRSHKELRLAVLEAIDETRYDLDSEIGTMPLSAADGDAFTILGQINAANGTRHFAKPANNPGDWYRYTTRNRQYKLAGVADASADAGSEYVTDSSGWRLSADTVTNQQQASASAIAFLDSARVVWTHDALPLVVEGTLELFVDFPDFIDSPTVESEHTGSSVTVTLTPFGHTGKLEIVSSGTTTFQMLRIRGFEAVRGDDQLYVANDLTSQADPRGVRAGNNIAGDLVGVLAMARGIAEHVVWRYGNPQLRPTLTVHNWFPEQFELDLFDTIAVTIDQFMASAVIFEIVGLTHVGDCTNPAAVHHTTTYVLQESRVQTPTAWFTLDSSQLDGDDVLAY